MKERNFVHTASDCTCYTSGRADRPGKGTGNCMLMFTRTENKPIAADGVLSLEKRLWKALCIMAVFLFLYIYIFNTSLSH